MAVTAMALALGAAPAVHAGSGPLPDIDAEDGATPPVVYDIDDGAMTLPQNLCLGFKIVTGNIPSNFNGSSATLTIYNSNGSKAQGPINVTVSGGQVSLAVNSLSSGTYYVIATASFGGYTVGPLQSKNFTLACGGGGGGGGGGLTTPELGSGELLASGLLGAGAVVFYRRRARRRATSGGDQPQA